MENYNKIDIGNDVTGEKNIITMEKKETLIHKLFSFKGRRSRQGFLMYLLIVLFIAACIAYISHVIIQDWKISCYISNVPMLILAGVLVFTDIYILLTNIVKRSHDFNISAWFPVSLILGEILLIILLFSMAVLITRLNIQNTGIVDTVGFFVTFCRSGLTIMELIYGYCLFLKKGTIGANRFGPDPLIKGILGTKIQEADGGFSLEKLITLNGVLTWKGRKSRKQYIMWSIPINIICVLIYIAGVKHLIDDFPLGYLSMLVFVFAFYCQMINMAKRVHDMGFSAKWILGILGVMIIIFTYNPNAHNHVWLDFICMGCKGTKGPNKYGPDPLGEVGNVEKVEEEKQE